MPPVGGFLCGQKVTKEPPEGGCSYLPLPPSSHPQRPKERVSTLSFGIFFRESGNYQIAVAVFKEHRSMVAVTFVTADFFRRWRGRRCGAPPPRWRAEARTIQDGMGKPIPYNGTGTGRIACTEQTCLFRNHAVGADGSNNRHLAAAAGAACEKRTQTHSTNDDNPRLFDRTKGWPETIGFRWLFW